MNSKDFLDKDVFAEDLKIGKVKELGIDPEDWKVTHLEIELEKNIAESVLARAIIISHKRQIYKICKLDSKTYVSR